MNVKQSRLILFGCTELTQIVADKLMAIGINPVGVVTSSKEFSISYSKTLVQNVRYFDMKLWAESSKIPYLVSSDSKEIEKFIKATKVDTGLVVGWYHFIKTSTCELLKDGCIGIHASLLPKLRGGAPLNWAILSGQKQTGVSLFQITDGVDDGPVYAQKKIQLQSQTNITGLLEKSQQATIKLIQSSIPKIINGELRPCKQTGVPSYSLQRIPDDGQINWRKSALEIDRLVRAVSHPYPGAFTFFDSEKVMIWNTEIEQNKKFPQIFGMPGQIINLKNFDAPFVVTGSGSIAIKQADFEDGSDALPLLKTSNHRRFNNLFT